MAGSNLADRAAVAAAVEEAQHHQNTRHSSLPGDHDAMISHLAKLSKKTVVVLNANLAALMPWIDEVDAVIESWYGGQQNGLALERLLFGDISPSGKLLPTFPKRLGDTIQISDVLEVDYNEGLYAGYKRYDEYGIEPLFPFGHGLMYSTFELENLSVEAANDTGTKTGSTILWTFDLANTGSVTAQQVVRVYVSYPEAAQEPPKLLKAFAKVNLKPGETTQVTMPILRDDQKIWDEDWKLVSGKYTFLGAFSAGDMRVQEKLTL